MNKNKKNIIMNIIIIVFMGLSYLSLDIGFPSLTVDKLKKVYFSLKIGFSFYFNYSILILYRKYRDVLCI